MSADKIFILSTKHGLLDLEEEIEPYDQTLNNMGTGEIRIWQKATLTVERVYRYQKRPVCISCW